MKITKRQLDDQLQLLKLAGFDTDSGWDYAIPQAWADSLRTMGLEHYSFVADCTGGFPVLVDSLISYPIILNNRSKANEEIFNQLFIDNNYSTQNNDYNFIVNDEIICAESDAGLLDLNIVIRAFEAGRNSK